MSSWLNRVVIAAPRNTTAAHTIDPASGTVVSGAAFTPTAGRLLVCLLEGAVTSTTPSGWDLEAEAVFYTGLYCWSRTAVGSDTISTTHNGSNYPVVAEFIEFPAGTTLDQVVAATEVSGDGGAGPALVDLPAGTRTVIAAAGQVVAASTVPTWTWAAGTELVDTGAAFSATDGYSYSSTVVEGSTATDLSIAATSTDTTNPVERIILALTVPATIAGTVSATTAVSGTLTRAQLAGVVPATSAVSGAVVRSSVTGTVPAVATVAGTVARSSSAGTVTATTQVSGTLPRSSVSAQVAAATTVAGVLPVSSITAQVATVSGLSGTLPRSQLAGLAAATSTVSATLTASDAGLAGQVVVVSAASAVLSRSTVAATVAAVSTAAGTLTRSSLAGAAAAVTAVAGALVRSTLTAVVAVVSAVRGTVSPGVAPQAPAVRTLTVIGAVRTLDAAGPARALTVDAPIRILTIVEDL